MRDDILQEMLQVPLIREIIEHESFISMKEYRHHGRVNCYDHSMDVAVITFRMAGKTGLDVVSATRAALLHDFYLYDWHTGGPGLHGFRHPAISLRNAKQYFQLNKIEENAVKRHMWPLTPIIPVYPEAILVSLADKAATFRDYWRTMLCPLRGLFFGRMLRSSNNSCEFRAPGPVN